MLSFITFALIHNTLVTLLYFLFIGIYRSRGLQEDLWMQSAESLWVILTGMIVGKFYEIPPAFLLVYLFLLLIARSAVRRVFPGWIDIYRKFYGFLILTEFLYLSYKLTYMVESLMSAEYLLPDPLSITGMGLMRPIFLGQLFFLLLLFSETFVLVSSAYAIYDAVSLMAGKKQNDLDIQASHSMNPPMVSLHVPICREPPDMVIETLSALARMDYPNFEVIVVSNNTQDQALWSPVEQTCLRLGFKFLHFNTLPGYKAGALNRALAATSKQAQLIGVIDSDYLVYPGFLKRVTPMFQDPSVAFVQTAQDYRNRDDSLFLKMGYPVYKLFFDVVMVARNRRNSIMFAGTMGLIRKDVLEEIHGWGEQCVAEDAEASLRILNLGYRGSYLQESWGYGLLPTDFAGCEKQWSRWMTGGIQVVRINRKILFDLRSSLTFAQRWDYAVGGVMSFGAFLTISSALLLAGIALVIAISPANMPSIFADLSTSLLIFSFFITLTAIMVILTFKWNMNYSAKRSLGAFIFVMGLSWARARAVWLALTRKRLAFERTAKFPTSPSLVGVLWNTRYQVVMAALIILLNVVILGNYETPPPGVVIISVWQEITYLASVALSILSLKK
jgi:cellulose synthase/poly-beta-1,6-N-acetylglucosamine synthase-like glycosyltransferase